MLALYRSGRQAEALDVYRSAREALVEEFGIEPTSALHELERAILTQDTLSTSSTRHHARPEPGRFWCFRLPQPDSMGCSRSPSRLRAA